MRAVPIVSFVGALGLAVALTACSSDDDSSSATSGATSTTVSASDSAEGGNASVTIGGEAQDLPDKTVYCTEQNGIVNIAIGSGTGGKAIGARVTAGDSPQVEQVGIAATNGITYGWAKGTGGNVTATKDGNTYTLSGELTGVNAANPTAPQTKSFELKATCP